MKIAVITPSFNQGEFIENTIQSIIAQDYSSLEYVVMDGGSTDNTLEILKRYEHCLTWVSEPDKGQSHAINKGICRTTSDIIGWLNSDDLYYPHTLKKVCQFFSENPDIDVVYGDAHFIDRNGKILYPYPTENFRIERIKSFCFISQPAAFFRRRVIERFGFIDESLNFCMDYEYWLRLAISGAKFVYLPEVLAGTRVYPETKTSRCVLEASLEAFHMLQKRLGYVPSDWMINYCSALVKSNSNLHYPQLRFIFAVWLNLWKVTAHYYKGFARIPVWLKAQWALLNRFFRKYFK